MQAGEVTHSVNSLIFIEFNKLLLTNSY